MSEYIVEMYDECEKYFSEYGCKPTNTQGFPLREEIVRCRDCKYYMDYEHEYEPNLGYCGFHDMQEVRDSRFCAWASKRKEGGE